MGLFEEALKETLGIEGGYSDNKKDLGGKTNWGITEALAREYGYLGDMKTLTVQEASRIYKEAFWQKLKCDSIGKKCPGLAKKVFDTGVNVGTGRAGMWLQRLLNALNLQESKYADITVDGAIGARTLASLDSFVTWRGQAGEIVLLKGLNCLQGAYYVDISERRPDNEEFTFGWINKRIHL